MTSILPEGSDSKTDTRPSDAMPGEACACGHDETDHGDVTGCIHCIHCGRYWEYVPRSSYVHRPAADSREQVAQVLLSWAKEIVNHETSRDPYDVADEILSLLGDA